MKTPIADFVKEYAQGGNIRFHMPGHKGNAFLGCEAFDITEVRGADELYLADGIIAESEANATALFGTQRTLYSTEGSSQCIRAMLYLALCYGTSRKAEDSVPNPLAGHARGGNPLRPYVVAARNAHKAFLYAAALLDLDVVWLWPEEMHSLCSCRITPKQLEAKLQEEFVHRGMRPIAVYVTSPDYLGGRADVRGLAEVAHQNGTILAVDNAHGAYLHFLQESLHPMDLGADICCDSAHKTLPVLTGGAYLHIGKNASPAFAVQAKQALALFGSTSPSYLTLMSLDLCNAYLADGYQKKLHETVCRIAETKKMLMANGWTVESSDELKVTIRAPKQGQGLELAEKLRGKKMECEYADEDYLVLMITPENDAADLERLVSALGVNTTAYEDRDVMEPAVSEQVCSIREALFTENERIPVEEAAGRICGAPTVGCPPAIPIVVSGEVIGLPATLLCKRYGICEIAVCADKK